jgi:hypothetical protein
MSIRVQSPVIGLKDPAKCIVVIAVGPLNIIPVAFPPDARDIAVEVLLIKALIITELQAEQVFGIA